MSNKQESEKASPIIYANARTIFIFSIKQYILLQSPFWRLTLISATLFISGLLLYTISLNVINNFPLSAFFLLIFLYFLFSIWLPFEFFVKLKILRGEFERLSLSQILKLFKEVLRNFQTLKQFTSFSWNWFIFTESTKFETVKTVFKSATSNSKITRQDIYPYLVNENLPFILADRKDPYQIYEFMTRIGKNDQKEIDGFIISELEISGFIKLLFILILILPIQLVAAFILRQLPTFDPLILINFIPFLILIPLILIVYFLSPLFFLYRFYKYKLFWSKYF